MRWVKCKWCKYNENGDCRNPKSEYYKRDIRDIPREECTEGVD